MYIYMTNNRTIAILRYSLAFYSLRQFYLCVLSILMLLVLWCCVYIDTMCMMSRGTSWLFNDSHCTPTTTSSRAVLRYDAMNTSSRTTTPPCDAVRWRHMRRCTTQWPWDRRIRANMITCQFPALSSAPVSQLGWPPIRSDRLRRVTVASPRIWQLRLLSILVGCHRPSPLQRVVPKYFLLVRILLVQTMCRRCHVPMCSVLLLFVLLSIRVWVGRR